MLTGIFNREGLRKNVCKAMGIVCKPFWAARVLADKAYTQIMMGEGQSFKEKQRERVLCPECGKYLDKGSLVEHRQTQNGMEKGGSVQVGNEEDGGNNPRA